MSLKRDDERKRPDGAVMLKELHTKGWSWLRAEAARRPSPSDLLALIAHLEVGTTGEPAIRLATGWPEQRYKNACRRFATLVSAMPPDLSAALQEAIARAPANTGIDWRKARGTEAEAADADDEQEGDLHESDVADSDESCCDADEAVDEAA